MFSKEMAVKAVTAVTAVRAVRAGRAVKVGHGTSEPDNINVGTLFTIS